VHKDNIHTAKFLLYFMHNISKLHRLWQCFSVTPEILVC